MQHGQSHESLFELESSYFLEEEGGGDGPRPLRLTRGTLVDLGDRMLRATSGELSGIPAGYTYLGQFIDHDITLTKGHNNLASNTNDIGDLSNQTSKELNLSCLYWLGGLTKQLAANQKTGEMLLDTVDDCPKHQQDCHYDLPRDANAKAIIADPRNDENLLIAQLHVQFLRLHNHFVGKLNEGLSPEKKFEQARAATTASYQQIVVSDYLKRLLNKDIWDWYFSPSPDNIKTAIRELPFFYTDFIPKEFRMAAFRFGHGMVKSTYKLNKFGTKMKLNDLFRWTGKFQLNSRKSLPIQNVVDWHRFFKPKNIEAKLVSPAIPIKLPKAAWPENNLAIRNLFRGAKVRLLSAQDYIKRIHEDSKNNLPPNAFKEVERVVRAIENEHLNPEINLEIGANPSHIIRSKILDGLPSKEQIMETTPLWYYLLCECGIRSDQTMSGGPSARLGALTSLIIAETFYRLFKDLVTPNNPSQLQLVTSVEELINITQPKES